MYEKYLIRTDGYRNFTENNAVAGFELKIRIAYYRGVALAIVGDLEIAVDGHAYPRNALRVGTNGRFYTLDELGAEEKARWEFTETVTLRVYSPGGLAPGAHEVRLRETIKPAYIPGRGFCSEATKRITQVDGGAGRPETGGVGLGVSLYSYQEEFFTRQMGLEECLAEVSAIGATGVQLIAEQMMPGYPAPSSAWLDRWHSLIDRYQLTPTLMDTFVDVDCGGHRRLSIEEGVTQLVTQMKLARELGFRIIRPTTGPVADSAPELVAAALAHAERLDVRIAPEIHAPIPLRGGYIDSYLEMIARTGTRHAGFTLDMGVFCKSIPPAMVALARRRGAPEDMLNYVQASYRRNLSAEEMKAEVTRQWPAFVESVIVQSYRYFGPPTNEAEHVRTILPYIFNVHGKFYEVNDQTVEESVAYDGVMAELVRGGYKGSIDSEYEGQRLTQDAYVTDSCEQVRRHHLLMRRSLAKVVTTHSPALAS